MYRKYDEHLNSAGAAAHGGVGCMISRRRVLRASTEVTVPHASPPTKRAEGHVAPCVAAQRERQHHRAYIDKVDCHMARMVEF